MSNFIPMLSASPPPLDEGPSFEDEWGEGDFGGFQSAVGAAGGDTDSQVTSNGEAGAGFRPIVTEPGAGGAKPCEWQAPCSKVSHSNSNLSVHSALTDGPSSNQSSMHVSNHSSGHDSAIFSDEFQEESKTMRDTKPLENNKMHKLDTQDNTSQDSVTDSGLCSDISPVPKSEEYSDFVECKPDADTEDNVFRSAEDEMFQSADSTKGETVSLQDSGNEGPEEEEYEGVRTQVLSGDDPLDLKTSSITGEEEAEVEEEEEEEEESYGQFSPSDIGYSLPNNFIKFQAEEPCSGASDSPCSPPESSEDEDEERDSASPLEEFSTEESSHTDTLNDKCGPDEGNEDESSELSMVGIDPNWAADNLGTQSHIKHEFSSGQIPQDDEDFADFQSVPALAAPPSQESPPEPAAQNPPCDNEAQDEGSGDWLQDCMSDEEEFTDIRTSESPSVPEVMGVVRPEEEEEESDEEEFSGFMEAAPLDSGLAQQAGDTSTSNPEDDEEEEEDDEDDWAFKDAEDHQEEDFGSFVEPGDFNSGGFADFGAPADEGTSDDWAAFAEVEPAAPPPLDDVVEDDDEFADFEEVTPQQPSGVLSALKGTDGSNRLMSLLSNCFPTTDINGNQCELKTLLDLLTQEVRREQEPLPKQPGRGGSTAKSRVIDVNVWNNLKDLENTAALQYSWKTSTNNTHLLKALTIDTRNILMGHKKQAVPIFASGLGLLEPSRGPTDPAPPSDLPLAPTTVPDATHHPPPTPQDIPPAEFDWTSSGLTNPLDWSGRMAISATNLQLDLDFFANKPSSGVATVVSPTAALENELLHAIAPPQSNQPKALQPLETLLANMKFTPTALPAHKEEKLTLEAGRVIGNFQDLTFLRAKYLVFPIKGDTE